MNFGCSGSMSNGVRIDLYVTATTTVNFLSASLKLEHLQIQSSDAPSSDFVPSATDSDDDGVADASDFDDDNDGIADAVDQCPGVVGGVEGTRFPFVFDTGVDVVEEDAGKVTITVLQLDSSTNTADFLTIDDEAQAPSDYPPASGVLNFGAQGTSQSIDISIADDGDLAGLEHKLIVNRKSRMNRSAYRLYTIQIYCLRPACSLASNCKKGRPKRSLFF